MLRCEERLRTTACAREKSEKENSERKFEIELIGVEVEVATIFVVNMIDILPQTIISRTSGWTQTLLHLYFFLTCQQLCKSWPSYCKQYMLEK